MKYIIESTHAFVLERAYVSILSYIVYILLQRYFADTRIQSGEYIVFVG